MLEYRPCTSRWSLDLERPRLRCSDLAVFGRCSDGAFEVHSARWLRCPMEHVCWGKPGSLPCIFMLVRVCFESNRKEPPDHSPQGGREST